MQDFKIFSLGEVCNFATDKIFVSQLDEKNYISTENLLQNKSGFVLASSLPKILKTSAFQIGDVLVSNIRPYFKKILYANFSGGCSNDVLVFRANNLIDSKFLFYVLSEDRFFNYATATAKGTKMPRGDKNSIMKFEIKVPPLEVQKKIAAVLSCLDDKIELNNKINKNLEQQAQAIFKNMFPKIIDGDFSVGNYISPKRGKSLVAKNAVLGDFPVVAGGLEPATYHNQFNTKPPVITISASGANAGFIRLWNTPVWSSDSSFIDLTVTENVYFWYVVLKLRQKEIFDSQTGTAQPHIYPKHIENLSIKKLDEEKVKNFNSKVEPFFLMIGKNQQENERLAEMRDLLLPRLLNGEIDASQVEG